MKEIRESFITEIEKGYTFKGNSIKMGVPIFQGEVVEGIPVSIPLKTFNRHGLIAGATGTGKTKTLQAIAEGLSEAGVPVLLMDIKGDLSGLAAKGQVNDKITERAIKTGIEFIPKKFPTELLSISKEKGVRMRSTVIEFGPVLFSKVLGLNDTQSGLVSLIFKFCDDNQLPLLDLKDFKKVLQYITNEGKAKITQEYGNISTTSSATILRKVIDLEQQGAELFFGEKSFEVQDLCRYNKNGWGQISIFKLTDVQDRPKLFSTFMLSLLAEVYAHFPEAGDMDKPKLVIFMDEAHLIFEEASKSLNDQLETIIKLIRSKGVGIFFCTQNPSDIPADILGQLGLKVQHALRAFTANDRKAIKMTAENYPLSDFYNTEDILTSLGIGEALITALNEKGIPTPLAATYLRAPQSRMDILSDEEIDELISNSELVKKYNKVIDRESAFEILSNKIALTIDDENGDTQERDSPAKKGKSTFEEIMESSVTRQIGRTLARELTRGLLGVLGIKNSSSRGRSSKSIF